MQIKIISCCPVAKSCLTLWDPMVTPGFPVLHYLPEFAQIHVHWVSDLTQPSHSLVASFSSCSQSFPASGSFPMIWLFISGGQSIGASASVLAMNIQGWFPLTWIGLISLLSKELRSLLQHHSLKALILWHSAFLMVQLSHAYMTTGKTIRSDQISRSVVSDSLRPHELQHTRPPCPSGLTIPTFVSKVMSLLFNTLSRFAIAFLPRSKHLLISWLQSPPAVILELKKIKSATVYIFSPIYLWWSDGTGCHDLSFLNVEF